MENTIYLQIPPGNDIKLTIQAIRDFFAGTNESGRQVLIGCIPIQTVVPGRFIEKEVRALKEAIINTLVSPEKWVHKELTIAFIGISEVVNLDANRCIIST